MKLIDLSRINPNPHQPRTQADPNRIQELAADILARSKTTGELSGLIHAITVQANGDGESYIIIAGHRRFAAFQWLSTTHPEFNRIPAEVVPVVGSDQALFELAVTENSIREDLTFQDKAKVVEKAVTQFGYTYEQAAKLLGFNARSHAHKLQSLLVIKDQGVWDDINTGAVGFSHVLALLPILKLREGEELLKSQVAGIKNWGLTVTMVVQQTFNLLRSHAARISETRLDEEADEAPLECAATCSICAHLITHEKESWCARPEAYAIRFRGKRERVKQVEPCPACGGAVYWEEDNVAFPLSCDSCRQAWTTIKDFRADIKAKDKATAGAQADEGVQMFKNCPRCGKAPVLSFARKVACPHCQAEWNTYSEFSAEIEASQKAPSFSRSDTLAALQEWGQKLHPNAEARASTFREIGQGEGAAFVYFVKDLGHDPLHVVSAANELASNAETAIGINTRMPLQACHVCLAPEGVDPLQLFTCQSCGLTYHTLIGLSLVPWASPGQLEKTQALLEKLPNQAVDLLAFLLDIEAYTLPSLAAELLKVILVRNYDFD